MKIILPLEITGANLIDTNVTETLPVWDEATAYVTTDQVRVIQADGTGIAYEALAGNTGKDPAENPAEWLDLGPTNLWAMFDKKVGTRTVLEGSVDVTIDVTGRADSLALLNLTGTDVDVVVADADGNTIYDENYPLVSVDGIDNWYDYFFAEIETTDKLILTDLPNNYNTTVRITVNYADATAGVGWFAIGRLVDIGVTEKGMGIGITDYSIKEADDFGNLFVSERPYSGTVIARVLVEKRRVDPVYRTLAGIRATPVVWIPAETYTSSIVVGFFREFKIAIEYPTYSLCNIEIEGLT